MGGTVVPSLLIRSVEKSGEVRNSRSEMERKATYGDGLAFGLTRMSEAERNLFRNQALTEGGAAFFAGNAVGGQLRPYTSEWKETAIESLINVLTDGTGSAYSTLAKRQAIEAIAGKTFTRGSFSLFDWSRYPTWAPKPNGTFRLLTGDEYEAARKAANLANAALRRTDPAAYAGRQIHEIVPVKYGGSPTDIANKIAVTPMQHIELTNFWNQLMRDLP